MLLDLKYIPFTIFSFLPKDTALHKTWKVSHCFQQWKTQRNEAVGYSHPLMLKSHIVAIHYLPFRST